MTFQVYDEKTSLLISMLTFHFIDFLAITVIRIPFTQQHQYRARLYIIMNSIQ